jgi:hypothetical protein
MLTTREFWDLCFAPESDQAGWTLQPRPYYFQEQERGAPAAATDHGQATKAH